VKIIADANIPFVAECFSSIGEVEVVIGREITQAVVADADVLIVRSVTHINSGLLDKSRVRFVGTATIGFDHVDTEYLSRKNVGFASAPGSNANSAAEYVIAALLEIGHKHRINLEGKSIGIIGVGNVGSRVAEKAAALGMKVKLNDPPLQRQTKDPKYLPIEELFDCDVITLHTPLTFDGVDKTFHLADKKFFQSLKQKCVFINASRGAVVDSRALKAAIQTNLLKAVALDVWEDEPNIDSELLEMVDIGTPHIAGYSLDGKITGMIMIYKTLCDYFGLKAKYSIEDFLPEPIVPELTVNPYDGDEQEVLWKTVRKIYNISKDDHKLRDIIKESAEKKGQFFGALRKNYPVRREFQNTKVLIATEKVDSRLRGNDKSKAETIAKKLAGIGFKEAEMVGWGLPHHYIVGGLKPTLLEWPRGRLDFSSGCLIMGVLNVTPDSFSDGGQFFEPDKAIEHGLKMAADGAVIIDIGGESTRPGSEPISPEQQIKRVVPVIKALCKEIDVPISIDTYNYEVAKAALDSGAAMINDITALSDERMGRLAAEQQVPVVLMHMQGAPQTMQIEPKYNNVVSEVQQYLLDRAKRAEQFGIPKERIFIDPGIGFGKTLEHNLLILRSICEFIETGYRVLVGTSRKSFIGKLTGKENPAERIFGTAATVALCAAAGVSIVRVHDVAEMADVIKVVQAVKKSD